MCTLNQDYSFSVGNVTSGARAVGIIQILHLKIAPKAKLPDSELYHGKQERKKKAPHILHFL